MHQALDLSQQAELLAFGNLDQQGNHAALWLAFLLLYCLIVLMEPE